MNNNVTQELSEIVSRGVTAIQPERIYLIGSHAYGTVGPESDIDLLAVIPDSTQSIDEQERRAYLSLIGCRSPVDIIVLSHSQMAERVEVVSSLPYLAEHKGKLLYAAEGQGSC